LTLIVTHPSCLEHDPGPEHPETPARLETVIRALQAVRFANAAWDFAPRVEREDLQRAHSPDYIERIWAAIPRQGLWNIDPDTVLSPQSGEAAMRAAGAVCAAVDAVCEGRASNAFCAVRPPGHHAEREHSIGFCLFNNLAVAAEHARHRHGLDRIAIVDVDAHHGNGAQNIFWNSANTFVASLHQWPSDLLTGNADECGAYDQILNLPLEAMTGSAAFRLVFQNRLLPRLRDFHPELILVAAGFDSHRADPLTNLLLETEDFHWIAAMLRTAADDLCAGRLVASLEGGYHLDALGASVSAFVSGMMGQDYDETNHRIDR
jgi:acetoin utilization deacetylase AcuC-like enzyme